MLDGDYTLKDEIRRIFAYLFEQEMLFAGEITNLRKALTGPEDIILAEGHLRILKKLFRQFVELVSSNRPLMAEVFPNVDAEEAMKNLGRFRYELFDPLTLEGLSKNISATFGKFPVKTISTLLAEKVIRFNTSDEPELGLVENIESILRTFVEPEVS